MLTERHPNLTQVTLQKFGRVHFEYRLRTQFEPAGLDFPENAGPCRTHALRCMRHIENSVGSTLERPRLHPTVEFDVVTHDDPGVVAALVRGHRRRVVAGNPAQNCPFGE